MKTFKDLSFTEKIEWRIRALWALLAAMLAYMVIVGELGLGDSRIMSRLAVITGKLIFFGGMGWVIYRIVKNKKLLKNPYALRQKKKEEEDERNQYLHDKSGGIVWDIIFILLLFITVTASLTNMPAFYVSLAILLALVVVKSMSYLWYRK